MKTHQLTVTSLQRMDAFIAQNIEGLSRSHVQKLIETGEVKVNGQVIQIKKHKVMPEDVIDINIPEAELLNVQAEDIPIDIIYEDDHLMVVYKPVGMVVHPAPGNYTGTLVNALMFYSDKLSEINGIKRPGIVHRIDKDTSGLLMVAKTDLAHQHLAAQLKAHTIERTYVAIVHGRINEEKGTINAPIARSSKDRLKMAVTSDGKEAITHFEVIKRFRDYTYVSCQLETGRTHQIRVHMSYIKHPLLGDMTYGIKNPKIKNDGQLLHAKSLGFIHPVTEEAMFFDSEVPDIFEVMLKKIKGVEGGDHEF